MGAVCKKIVQEMILELSGLFTFLALGFWGTRVDVGDFYTLITNKIPEGAPAPDIPCMMSKCGSETFSCLTDRMCLKALACIGPCGDDQACTFHCISNYETPLFHALNKCNIHDAGCIVLKEPATREECGGGVEPAIPALDINDMMGQWFITMGLSPIYDCFPCQIFTFAKDEADGRPMVYMDYQVDRVFGDTVNKTVIEHIEQPDAEKEGLLIFGGVQNGLFHSERWRILEFDGEFMIAAYCGTMTSWVYNGTVVLTKNPHVNKDLAFRIREALLINGYKTEDFCSPKILGCSIENLRVEL